MKDIPRVGFLKEAEGYVPVYPITDRGASPSHKVILKSPTKEYHYLLKKAEETFLDRLEAEHVQVADRLEKLDRFIDSADFYKLGYADQDDLKEQQTHMGSYARVLSRRLKRLKNVQ